jgi:hypothetical protein
MDTSFPRFIHHFVALDELVSLKLEVFLSFFSTGNHAPADVSINDIAAVAAAQPVGFALEGVRGVGLAMICIAPGPRRQGTKKAVPDEGRDRRFSLYDFKPDNRILRDADCQDGR